jgi:hypothetical protein
MEPGILRGIPAGARSDLLRVLQSAPHVRADVIRQLYERRDGLADVLIDLEEDDVLRLHILMALERSLG